MAFREVVTRSNIRGTAQSPFPTLSNSKPGDGIAGSLLPILLCLLTPLPADEITVLDDERQQVKFRFLERFGEHLDRLRSEGRDYVLDRRTPDRIYTPAQRPYVWTPKASEVPGAVVWEARQ